MKEDNLEHFMTTTQKGKKKAPLFVTRINESYILAAYQGSLSKYDILIKYRQKSHGKWSRIRALKHIYWAIDILIKMHHEKDETKNFLKFLVKKWEKISGIKSKQSRKESLNIDNLIRANRNTVNKYKSLEPKGEYRIQFLILLAQLLLQEEKNPLLALIN